MGKFGGEEWHNLTHILKDSLLLLCEIDPQGGRGRNVEAGLEVVAVIRVRWGQEPCTGENKSDNGEKMAIGFAGKSYGLDIEFIIW